MYPARGANTPFNHRYLFLKTLQKRLFFKAFGVSFDLRAWTTIIPYLFHMGAYRGHILSFPYSLSPTLFDN